MSEFDKKISALTSGTDSTATDEYVIARGGSNFKISGALVAAGATKVGTLASLAVTGNVSLGADVVLSRGAADRLDLASGDSLNIVSGTVKIAGTDVLGATTLGSGVTASSLTSVGTLASLAVTGDLTVDTDTLKVDAANNRVGIGTATPGAPLDVTAAGIVNARINNTASSADAYLILKNTAGESFFGVNATGPYIYTATAQAMTFATNNIDRMRIDASGNVGIGGTPSAWSVLTPALQLGTTGSFITGQVATAAIYVGTNAYFDGANFRYTTSGAVASYAAQANGVHSWHNAPAGTAGDAITFTERARITAGGYFKASNDGTYVSATGTYHEFNNDAVGNPAANFKNTSATFNGQAVIINTSKAANTDFNLLSARANDVAVCIVRGDGNVTNTNNSYGQISDLKVKQDVVDAGSNWDDIKGVRVRKFRFKNNPTGPLQIGVVAQELEAVSPGLIDEAPDYEEVKVETEVEKSRPVMHEVEEIVTDKEGVESLVLKSVPMLDEDGKPITETYTETETRTERVALGTVTKSVKYSVLYMKAVGALQEAIARIESLEARLDALEN